ncbi:hypothetical protein [Mycolicibacterium mageritense]|uniref:Uncharacterized protein n=1 Tax=Mycolicibacterium mageritense TaxID=53462 RepID=A0AAI8XSD2_MYCME|nr:hypothetical protein [Mycolicibacterium mageritense]BDY32997.1 hypothetical protein hbim_06969 [Mycolicibacterium mageritense]
MTITAEHAANGVRVTRHVGRLPVFVVIPHSRIREFCAAILAIIEADAGQVHNIRSQSVECHAGEPIRLARTADGKLRVSRVAGGVDHFITATEGEWADIALQLLAAA